MSNLIPLEMNEKKVLEALIVENQDLERLEMLLEQFNIFEALGVVKVELRHSDFLAFLLNPNQNHGLGASFTKQLLQKAIAYSSSDSKSVNPIDLALWDLDGVLVLREWQNIDILLVDEINKIIVAIENKVVSAEHGDQLSRYRKIVYQNYPDWKHLFIFLTPEGE